MTLDTFQTGAAYDVSLPGLQSGGIGDDLKRDSPRFCQRLVDYFLKRRSEFDGMWDLVDANYRHKGLEVSANPLSMQVDEIFPGRVYSLVHTIESQVAHDSPKFYLRGFTGIMEPETVPAMEDALNNEWMEDSTLDRETRLSIRDCIKYGRGIALTSFEADEDYDVDQATQEADEERAMAVSDPIAAQMTASIVAETAAAIADGAPEVEEETFEGDSRVICERVSTRRVSVRNFLIDPDATSEHDAKWMGRVVIADYEAVLRDPSFKRRKEIKPTSRERINFLFSDDADKLNPYKCVALYELFLRQPGGGWKLVVFADGHDFFMKEKMNPYWIGCPYDLLSWNDDGETAFPQSDILPVMSQILGERILLSKLIDAHSRQGHNTTFHTCDLDENLLKAARAPGVEKYVKVGTQVQGNLSSQFHKNQNEPISPEGMNLLAILEREIQVGSGIGPNQAGQAMKSETSATEAAEVAGFSRARGAHKFKAVEMFIASIARKRLGITAQFFRENPENVAYIAGKEAAAAWAKMRWTKGDVQRNLKVNVEPGSMRPINDDQRLKQLISFLGLAMQNPVWAAGIDQPGALKRAFQYLGFRRGDPLLLDQDPQKWGVAQALMGLLGQGGKASMTAPESAPANAGAVNQTNVA